MKKKAFTLTELLVVVVIIGVLSAVVLPKFTKILRTRKTTEAENIMTAVRNEQEARCMIGRDYAADAAKLASLPKNVSDSKNYTYSLNETGITAASKDGDYSLIIPSYTDGRICCSGADCANLNKNYPLCSQLSVAQAACTAPQAYVDTEEPGPEPNPEPEPEPNPEPQPEPNPEPEPQPEPNPEPEPQPEPQPLPKESDDCDKEPYEESCPNGQEGKISYVVDTKTCTYVKRVLCRVKDEPTSITTCGVRIDWHVTGPTKCSSNGTARWRPSNTARFMTCGESSEVPQMVYSVSSLKGCTAGSWYLISPVYHCNKDGSNPNRAAEGSSFGWYCVKCEQVTSENQCASEPSSLVGVQCCHD